jgi:PAS domain S-box-containing protein
MDIPNLHSDILNKLQTGVVVHGPDTQIVFSNPRAEELLGLSQEQLRGKTAMDSAWQFIDDSGRAMAVSDYPVNRVLATGQAVKGMVLGVNASAHPKTVWLLVSAFPQYSADGQLTQVVVDFHDISEVKRAQFVLQAHEAFTASVLDSLSEHIAVLDRDARIVAVNLAWRQFGQDNGAPTEVLAPIGMNYLDVGPVSGDTVAQTEGTEACVGIAAVLNGQKNKFQLEYPCHSPTEKRWFRMNVTPLQGERGGAVVSHLNITEQRKTELEAQLNMQLLMGSIETIDEAFVIYDAAERLVFCNEKYRKLYPYIGHLIVPGTRFEDIIRASAEFGFYLESAGQSEPWVQERLAAFRSGNQTRIQRAFDGRVLRAVERKMADGHTVGFRIDITELVTASDAALAASRAKSQFLATMSHEIRTPMNGILGMAQMLLEPELQDSLRNSYARTILSSGKTLLSLLNDVLDLSKIEAGKLQLESTAFTPQTLIHETCNLFAGAAQTKGLQLDGQFHGAPEQRYLADASRLRQMLANLVGNAIKFTRTGQVRLDARELEHTEDTSVLEFSVSDTGIGIPADKLGLLFQPFSQTDSSTTREFGGSGLGLSIVSHLAQAMGGDVGVSSEFGRGSKFWFRIPTVRSKEALNSPAVERLSPEASVATRLFGHVLVAEDNLVNCMVIESLLLQLGLTFTVVHDGQKAVDAILQCDSASGTGQGKLPDLILMDLRMPVMDGYSASENIRRWEAQNQRKRIPIIALTADAYEEDRQQCLTVGMDDFVTKPIALDALKLSLGKWLNRQPCEATRLADGA